MKRKIPLITRHVEIFMLHVFFVLDVIMEVGKFCNLLVFVVFSIFSMN